jgi:hypothetical protein
MSADVDIDLADRQQLLALIQHTPARNTRGAAAVRHNTGIYATPIPYDPMNQCAALDHETAEQRGYFKIDLLNQSVYQLVRDPQHLDELMSQTPPWARLWQDPAWASQLVHVGNYTSLLATMKPDSIPRMAALLSVIRPGKAHLQGKPWAQVFAEVWDGDGSRGFVFKKAHAISYAHLVVLHMILLDTPH